MIIRLGQINYEIARVVDDKDYLPLRESISGFLRKGCKKTTIL